MAGWYLVLILLNGHVTVNQSPFGTEAACRQQLAQMQSIQSLAGACVDLEPPQKP